jgi:hypothetical protein
VVMQGLASLTDDPQILGAGKAAMELNVQGVRSYKGGDLVNARRLFREALEMQPRNISIALNLAQSLLHAKGSVADPLLLEECRACLTRIGSLPVSDPRHERYQSLHTRAFEA